MHDISRNLKGIFASAEMSSSDEGASSPTTPQKRYKGVRRRKWGKWVSEIRVPGSQERLWLGSYVAPEAAAVAHDIAYYCLRERTSPDDFNFPLVLPAGVERGMSPRSVQNAATDAGMAVDAKLIANSTVHHSVEVNENGANAAQEGSSWQGPNGSAVSIPSWEKNGVREGEDLDISVEDYL